MVMSGVTSQPNAKVSNATDAELIKRCIGGEEQAWELLVMRYNRLIYSVSLSICHDRDVAADMLQQVYLEMYQKLGDLRDTDKLPGWLSTIARRKTYNHLRSIGLMDELSEDNRIVEATDEVVKMERQHLLERALEQMPDRCRRLIELLYLSPTEPSYNEISNELAMPVASIGPTRIRCLNKLRKILS
jgi:RNA polymerase sigma factor (sigma-70 family)